MRFLLRALAGMSLVVLTCALLALAGMSLMRSIGEGEGEEQARGPGAERVFAVETAELTAREVAPVLTAYGWVESARRLEIRAAVAGRIVDLAPGFRAGGTVEAGERLYRLDPAEAETARALAVNDLDAAMAEEEEARAAVTLAQAEFAASLRQRDLRARALARTRDLRVRGIGTEADLETAELALAAADQALTSQRAALAASEARIASAAIAVARSRIARDEALRTIADLEAFAPFAAALSDVVAVPGARVSAGEKLGLLLDPAALDVAVTLSHAEFARLADAEGRLRPLDLVARLGSGADQVEIAGRLDRAAASTSEGETGRRVYATLSDADCQAIRPGDFVTLEITEPPLDRVAVVPATALGETEDLLLVGDDGRLEALPVRILRRQGDVVIVAQVPFGRTYVTGRQPQLGPGIRVRPATPGPGDGMAPEAMIRLSPERRAGLIAAVRTSERIGAADRARIIATLAEDEVPRAIIDRLERRTGG